LDGGYKPSGYKPASDVYIPPGSWEAMAEAALEILEIEMGKRMQALMGDRYPAACKIVSPKTSWAPAAKAVGQNGAGSESPRETRYGTTSRAVELFLAMLAEIDNIERNCDRT
jgi:hypothetical protein